MVVIILTDHNSKLQKSKEMYKITFGYSGKPIAYIPAMFVEQILIDTAVSITSGAFELIKKNSTPVFWKSYDDISMFLLPAFNNGMVKVRKAQYLATTSNVGSEIALEIIKQTAFNKITVMKRINRKRPKFKTHLDEIINSMNIPIKKLKNYTITNDSTIDDHRFKLMGLEGTITKLYFQFLRIIFESYGIKFNKRSRRPSQDIINAHFNYGYAILRSQVTQFIVISGLDIFAGFLHQDRSGKSSLVLDIMEEFRQICVDEVIIEMVLSDLIKNSESIELSEDEKKLFVEKLFEKLDIMDGKNTLKMQILNQSRKLTKFLLGKNKKYVPYKLKVIK